MGFDGLIVAVVRVVARAAGRPAGHRESIESGAYDDFRTGVCRIARGFKDTAAGNHAKTNLARRDRFAADGLHANGERLTEPRAG